MTKKYEIGSMCSYGLHLLTEKTLGRKKNGEQYCKPCLKAYRQQYLAYDGGKKSKKREIGDLCANDHLLTEDNTFINKRGVLCCRDCASEARSRYMKSHRDRHHGSQAIYYRANKEPIKAIRQGLAPTMAAARAVVSHLASI